MRRELYDEYGNLIVTQDERGYIDTSSYFWALNTRMQSIQDYDDVPSGADWTVNAPPHLMLISDYEYDDLGRMTQSLGPEHYVDLDGVSTTERTAAWTVYQDADNQLWSAQGFATGSYPSYSYMLVNPVSLSITDDAGRTTDRITATRASTTGKLAASDTFPQSSWVRWSTTQYNDQNQQTSSRSYWHIPASGSGTVETNFYQTTYGYDEMNRQNLVVNPVGTISRTVFDVRNLTDSTWGGTNDVGATDADPNGSGIPNNMLQFCASEYDEGAAGGDGNLTQSTQYVDASGTRDRVTNYEYDWQNRQTVVDGEIDYCVESVYDNLNQVIQINRYDSTTAGNQIAQSKTFFDNLVRTYQSQVYAVDPTTETGGNAINVNTWYDLTGNVLKQKPAGSDSWTKMVYDSVGRNTIRYQGHSTEEEHYEEAGSIEDSIVWNRWSCRMTMRATSPKLNRRSATTTRRPLAKVHSTAQRGAIPNPATTTSPAIPTVLAATKP